MADLGARERIRVLLAEAEPEGVALLRDALEAYRPVIFEVEHVGRLGDALRRLDADGHDVFVLDLDLPDSHGLGTFAAAAVHAGERPIVVLVGPGREADGLKAVQHGAAEYLLKTEVYDTLAVRSILHAVQHAAAARALHESHVRYRALFEQSRDPIYMTDADGRIIDANAAFVEATGLTSGRLLGRRVQDWFADAAAYARLTERVRAEEGVRDFEARLLGRGRGERWCLISCVPQRDRSGAVVGYQGILHDITERKQHEKRLLHEALHDPLTGLPNRALFFDRLERALLQRKRAKSATQPVAVLFIDLDRFKHVNDSLGHVAGDRLLIDLAVRLSACLRAGDTVARLGGDEFGILLDPVQGPPDAIRVADRVHSLLETPFTIETHEIFVTASIGMRLSSEDPDEAATHLVRDADIAMYRAKGLGRARSQLFDENMHERALSALQLESDLRRGLEREEFVLHYQPFYELATGRLAGFEALLRWAHPTRGLLTPASFIAIAEDTGMIVPIGAWVLGEACAQARAWRDAGAKDLRMAVNLSTKQLMQPDLVQVVERALRAHGLDPRTLALEITESAVLEKPDVAAHTLLALRRLGIRLSIDDFGTGYSSLSWLLKLPIDTLKIDRSFVSRLGLEERPSDLVRGMVGLASTLRLEVVAEGVETREQLEWLRPIAPGYVQGFLFSRPLPALAAASLAASAH